MKKTIYIIDGPNLNLQGRREPEIYGTETLDGMLDGMREGFPDFGFRHVQSNSEGQIIDWIHKFGYDDGCQGIVLNAGAYTHTSLAIADAIAAVPAPVVEVHISNIAAREKIRRDSMLSAVCDGTIFGFGLLGYELAAIALMNHERD